MRCAILPILLLAACTSTIPNRNPVGGPFPSVAGKSLDGATIRIPGDYDEPLVLLVGYVMNAQFDLDRWLIGLQQVETPVKVFELPTIPGLMPGLFSGAIDGGMRSGIPVEDWGGVVTLYGDDASRVVQLLGNERPRNGRVLLLDREGRVVWFHDRGFSAAHLMELDRAARALAL